jgi:hypothetical protein
MLETLTMKFKIFMLLLSLTAITACSSPVKKHNKETQHKVNKLENIKSGPLSKPDTSLSDKDASVK